MKPAWMKKCLRTPAHTRKLEHVYQAAMLDPHTASELSPDDIVRMVDELIEAHGEYMPKFN